MPARIRITAGDVTLTADLLATPTAKAVEAALPFESTARTWGDEVYFDTPVSRGDEIRLASPVNVFARTTDDVRRLRGVRAGSRIRVESAD